MYNRLMPTRAILCLLALIAALPTAARQRAKASGGRARMHRQQPGAKIFDVTVDRYKTIQGKDDGSMVISGTDVVVDSVEANDPRSTTRLQARTFTIFPVKDKPRLTERVEAEGNFRFS